MTKQEVIAYIYTYCFVEYDPPVEAAKNFEDALLAASRNGAYMYNNTRNISEILRYIIAFSERGRNKEKIKDIFHIVITTLHEMWLMDGSQIQTTKLWLLRHLQQCFPLNDPYTIPGVILEEPPT